MLRIQYSRYGGPETLALGETATPEPGKGKIRVRVRAASANPMDWKIRVGAMKAMTGSRFPRGVGNDFAGIVEAVGPEVSRFKVGDAVFGAMGMREAAAFAETLTTSENNAALKPPSVSFGQAATLPIAGATAWVALIRKAKLQAGQLVFINGCLGAVGRAAVQIARATGADVAGSCRAEAFEEARTLGVTTVVDYRSFDAAPFRGCCDVVFDTAGSLSFKACEALLKPRSLALHIVPTPAKMIASLISTRQKIIFGDPSTEVLTKLAEMAAEGGLVISIGRTASLSEAIPALVELETRGTPKGKLVIVPG